MKTTLTWYSPKDALPKYSGRVLCIVSYATVKNKQIFYENHYDILFFSVLSSHWVGIGFSDAEVIAWTHLPNINDMKGFKKNED